MLLFLFKHLHELAIPLLDEFIFLFQTIILTPQLDLTHTGCFHLNGYELVMRLYRLLLDTGLSQYRSGFYEFASEYGFVLLCLEEGVL